MIIRKIIKILLIIILIPVVLAAGLFAWLTVTEYKPAETVDLEISGKADAAYHAGDRLTLMSWNIGYGALGDNADFFMDEGKMVMTADKERVQENMERILSGIEEADPDILFLQEVDRSSDRSYRIDECRIFRDRFGGYESSYGINHKASFVPYPVPPIGKVEAGVMTFTDSHVESARRIRLPVPFKWPVSTVNLKRCVMETRIPVYDDNGEESGKELVLLNLHLEAYDDGEGKTTQTRMLAEILNAERDKGNYVIAGGDFNQFLSKEDRETYPEQEGKWQPGVMDTDLFGDGWNFLMDKEIPSCRSLDQPYEGADHDSFQYYLIDGFIVSDNIQVEEIKNLDLDFRNSDHNPVILRIRL